MDQSFFHHQGNRFFASRENISGSLVSIVMPYLFFAIYLKTLLWNIDQSYDFYVFFQREIYLKQGVLIY